MLKATQPPTPTLPMKRSAGLRHGMCGRDTKSVPRWKPALPPRFRGTMSVNIRGGLSLSGEREIYRPLHSNRLSCVVSWIRPHVACDDHVRIHYSDLARSRSINGLNSSSGSGRNVVVWFSPDTSAMVCRNRNCNAVGSLLIISAACTSFSAA